MIISEGVEDPLRLVEVLGVIERVPHGEDPEAGCPGSCQTCSGVLETDGEIRCLLQTEQFKGLEIRVRSRLVVPDGISSDDDVEKMLDLIPSQNCGYFLRVCRADEPDSVSPTG